MSIIKTVDLCVDYDKKRILENINLTIKESKVTVILGSNGSGKSSLLNCLANIKKASSGSVFIDSKSITSFNHKELAKIISLLPQKPTFPERVCVIDLVKMAQTPYQNSLLNSKVDLNLVEGALKMTDTYGLKDELLETLSGGQLQRVWIAFLIAQNSDVMFLDEPTSFLDLKYQIEVLDIIHKLNVLHKKTIVLILHDVNLAIRYADEIIALKDKAVYCCGNPKEIITTKFMKDVYDIDTKIFKDPIYDENMFVAYSNIKERGN